MRLSGQWGVRSCRGKEAAYPIFRVLDSKLKSAAANEQVLTGKIYGKAAEDSRTPGRWRAVTCTHRFVRTLRKAHSITRQRPGVRLSSAALPSGSLTQAPTWRCL